MNTVLSSPECERAFAWHGRPRPNCCRSGTSACVYTPLLYQIQLAHTRAPDTRSTTKFRFRTRAFGALHSFMHGVKPGSPQRSSRCSTSANSPTPSRLRAAPSAPSVPSHVAAPRRSTMVLGIKTVASFVSKPFRRGGKSSRLEASSVSDWVSLSGVPCHAQRCCTTGPGGMPFAQRLEGTIRSPRSASP